MAYKLHIGLIKESSGYSSAVLNLPGVFSQGESRQEALYQVLDAFDLTIKSYLEYRETPPWASNYDISDFDEDFGLNTRNYKCVISYYMTYLNHAIVPALAYIMALLAMMFSINPAYLSVRSTQ